MTRPRTKPTKPTNPPTKRRAYATHEDATGEIEEYHTTTTHTRNGYRWAVYKLLDSGLARTTRDAERNCQALVDTDLAVREENRRREAIRRFRDGMPNPKGAA